ncbi:MAG: PilW family protein [Burkholderiales bacterium]
MSPHRIHRRPACGFSLIELLVSMVIALVVTLAITAVLTRSEGSKRATTSVNDANQTGAYLAYALDRSIRSAGSGFAQNWPDVVGCRIDASLSGATVLPSPALPVPFANVPPGLRLAPVIIGKNLAVDTAGQVHGDVLTVMSGNSGVSEMPQKVLPNSATPTTLRITNTMGYANNDLVLVADSGVDGGRPGCMLQQLAPAGGVNTDQLVFTGADYSRSNGSVFGLTAFGNNAVAIQMGSAPANPPQMLLYGVGDDSTLVSYDLLRIPGINTPPTPIADGVIEMRALYGIDTTVPSPVPVDTTLATPVASRIGAWIDPGDPVQGYTQAQLTTGSAIAQSNLRRIVAIRVGLILRSSLQERASDRYYGSDPGALPTTTLTLFGDLPAALRQTRNIVGTDNLYRYRTFEFTIPLRNVLFAP